MNIKEQLDRHKELKNFIEELGKRNCKEGNVNLIHSRYMDDHAMEIAQDCHGVDCDKWPFNCIDWEQAGEELSQDYRSIDWEGETYYYQEP